MAYNPYDDVIDQDPAYMAEGGGTRTGLVQPVTTDQGPRYISSGIAKAYSLLTPEEETLQEIERLKQLRELATAQALQGTKFEEYAGQANLPSFVVQSPGIKERLDQAGYQPQSFKEALSRFGQFFYGDQRKAFDKLSQGQELTQQDRNAIALSPLDTLDFIFPPVALTKLSKLGLKTVDDVLKASDDIPEITEVKNYFGGAGFIPEGVVRAPDMGGSSSKLSQKEVASLGGKATQEKIRIAKEPSIEKIKNFFNQNKDKYIGIGVEKFINDAKKNISFSEQDPVLSKTASGIRKDVETFAPEIVKQVQSYYTPQFIVREADLDLPSGPLDQFVKKYSDSFFEIVGRRPTQTELQNHIINTGPEEAKDYFSKTGYNKAMSAANPRYKDLIKPRPKTKLIDRVTEIGKTNPEFESNFNIALANLKQSDAKTNTIKNQYNILMKPYTEQNLEKPFSYESFGKYVRGQEDIPTRQKRLDLEDYESPLASKKKQNRNFKRVAKQITNKLSAFNLTGALPRFLKHQYRSMVSPNLRGRMLSGDEYMKKYIDPYVVYKKNQKGKDIVDKKATEEKFRSEYPNFAKWENMEKRIIKYDAKLNEFLDRLAIDGQYTELELDRIKSALEPQRSHEYNIDQLLKKNRMINVSENPDLVRVQPKVLNMVYQPVYDSALRKIFNIIEKADSLEQLKTMKPKAIYLPKKNQINADINVDVKDFNNQYDYLDAIYRQIDGAMKARGMVGHYDFNPKNKEILKGFNFDKDDQLGELISVGSKKKFTADDYLERMEDILNMIGYKKMVGNNFIQFKKGGPVKMALGGDPLTNMNQQQFTPDPAFEGEDYFNQAVESDNLYAFNPGKIFKIFSKTDAVYTPKKLPDPVAEQQAAPPGTTLPATQVVQPEDFAFQSFTLNKINDPQAPKAGTPQAWKQFLYGGGQGGKVPESEMFDTGLEQYLDDYARYYPDQKITKEQLNDYYEMSPIGNIEIKVKSSRGADFTPHSPSAQDPAYKGYVGGARHKEAGSQPLDRVGTDYREIVVKAGALPGDKKPFVSSGHYEEENVLGFTRVADYLQPDGRKVSVIQEMQTDMLTKVRKEQERLNALLKRIENIKANAAREIQSGDPYREGSANRALEALNAQVPPAVEDALRQHMDLIKPFPNEAARSSIPDYQKQMMDLQKNIDEILVSDLQQSKPETPFRIQEISQQQQKVLDSLLDLNRSSELEDMLKNVKVPGTSDTEELLQYANDPNVRDLETGARYNSLKDLELFPPIPFNKQADYVDLLLKSTIKDAQARGINKVAIYPPELVNERWGKRPDSDAGKKFRDLYGKVAIQQMKNIAKKYGGNAKVETVLNPNASDRGLTYYKTNIDGEYEYLKQDQLAQGLDPEEAQLFIDEQLNRNAHSLGSNQVIYSKEIAPGQTMDYYVQPYTTDASEKKFELIPLGPGDDRNAAQVLIEEYNPQEVQMFTITLDSDKAKEPMFMFKKKSGGSIDKDSLLSITDIFGEYGR